MKEVQKTTFFRMIFPKIPSQEECKTRRKADVKKIVCSISGIRNYVTAEELSERRERLIFKR